VTAYPTLGALLLAERKARGLTQAEAADLAGCSAWTWSHVENGHVPEVAMIVKMCTPFSVAPKDLEKLGLNAAADRLRRVREAEDDDLPLGGSKIDALLLQTWMQWAQLGYSVTFLQREPGVYVMELREATQPAAKSASRRASLTRGLAHRRRPAEP
jgi:transcriptional regulator with XRE-family HTH domain